MTAAHCTCSDQRQNPETNYPCRLSPNSNQIKKGENEITAFGGSNSRNFLTTSEDVLTWEIDVAHVMDGFLADVRRYNYDIAMLKINDKKMHDRKTIRRQSFFDPVVLKRLYFKDKSKLNTAKIIPVCLAAINTDTKSKKFRAVGWGTIYEEISSSSILRNPIMSSCMTSEASPRFWKFRNCDMESMKKGFPIIGRYWECEKNSPPPGYSNDRAKRCMKYWSDAGMSWDHLKNRPLIERLNEQDKMYIHNQHEDLVEVCYNPELLSVNGWCKVKQVGKPDPIPAWGMCSPSCNSTILKVGISTKDISCVNTFSSYF